MGRETEFSLCAQPRLDLLVECLIRVLDVFELVERPRALGHRGVALQVAFERQTLKPIFSLDKLSVMGLKGYRLWVRCQLDYGLGVNLIQRAEPHRGQRRALKCGFTVHLSLAVQDVAVQVAFESKL
jgi:hypothetical protein